MLPNHRSEALHTIWRLYQIYAIFWQYYQDKLDLDTGKVRRQLRELVDAEQDEELAEGLVLLEESKDTPTASADEYYRLFVGPANLLAPPYEGAYRNREQTLMQSETLAVRSFYARAGLELKDLNIMPDDHLGTELEFICYLLSQAGLSAAQGESERTRWYLELYREFFNHHLKQWVLDHCRDVINQAATGVCRGMALTMAGFFRLEDQRLNPV